ncbi:hypothetical protein [Candidatus Tisiphia endosymbiont of Nemotelus uliginosus]|uniref:hypothetical protein n=1 Tax=Candidatus Tisiphia endosymbiont of Nemotelus uliginosus TaxID=3077926 RepID=UPI0035C8F099
MSIILETEGEMQPSQVFKIDLEAPSLPKDLIPTPSISFNLDKFKLLGNEFVTKGIAFTHKFLQNNNSASIEEIKRKCCPYLLNDLANPAEWQASLPIGGKEVPVFKQEFLDEVKTLNNGYSPELLEFLQHCSQTILTPQKIAAKMLLQLANNLLTREELQSDLQNELQEYKKRQQDDAKRDWPRAMIILKNQDRARIIDIETETLSSLTNEQKDCIQTISHQGMLEAGWLDSAAKTVKLDETVTFNETLDKIFNINNVQRDYNIDLQETKGRVSLVIDIAKPGIVKLQNLTNMALRATPKEDFTLPIPTPIHWITGVVEADISALQGEEFTPGCSLSSPKITFYLSTFVPDLRLEWPEDKRTIEDPMYDGPRKMMRDTCIQSCLDEIATNGQQLSKAMKKLSELKDRESAAKLICSYIINSKFSGSQQDADSFLENLIETMNQEQLFTDSINKSGFFTDAINRGKAEVTAEKLVATRDATQEQAKKPLPSTQRVAVNCYMLIIQNHEEQKKVAYTTKFAETQFSKYLNSCNTLNVDNMEAILNEGTAILALACDKKEDQRAIRQNLASLFIKCIASEITGEKLAKKLQDYIGQDAIKTLTDQNFVTNKLTEKNKAHKGQGDNNISTPSALSSGLKGIAHNVTKKILGR